MGQVTDQLESIARGLGVDILPSTPVTGIEPSETSVKISTAHGNFAANYCLVNTSPSVLAQLLGEQVPVIPIADGGAQIKVNMLLKRLPQLRGGSSAEAFNGTFHINESYSQLQSAFAAAVAGELPDPLPAEIYCHSLTDPSILAPELQNAGVHTLTLFALHTPHELFSRLENPYTREDAQDAVLKTLNSVLAEPIEDCLYRDKHGKICIDVNTTVDIENNLAIASGNIFHTPLDWPWALNDDQLATWGVETKNLRILLCGSGAARGGGVSGIPGHNAAQAVLAALRIRLVD